MGQIFSDLIAVELSDVDLYMKLRENPERSVADHREEEHVSDDAFDKHESPL